MTDTSRHQIECEVDLTKALCVFLEDNGYRTRMEVPNMGQSIDIVATRNRWITAIEAKLRDWRRAVAQCRAHEVVADFVCIGIATKSVSSRLVEEAARRGYGIIHFDTSSGRCLWHMKPARNRRVWPAQRKRLSSNLRGINYVS